MAMQDIGRGVEMFKALISGESLKKISEDNKISPSRVMQLCRCIHRMMLNPEVWTGTDRQKNYDVRLMRMEKQFWHELADVLLSLKKRV